MTEDTTHFGYQTVPTSEKVKKVADVFHSVASKYDLMNDLMSLGIHRVWKQLTTLIANARRGDCILDLAGGTGDLTKQFSQQVGEEGLVILGDINASMLETGRNRLLDEGIWKNVRYSQLNAEQLPFPQNTFQLITIAFGLRNVTDKQQALNAMFQVLKPGGQLLVLEFSTPLPALKPLYDLYSFKILPALGERIAKDADSYQYLAESIRMHPDQTTLQNMLEIAGFEDCQYHNFSGGIVALHRGYKY